MAQLREQLQEAQDKVKILEEELAKTRSQLQKRINTERTVVDLTTGMSVEAKRQIEELQRRVHVLEQQNARLKKSIAAEDAAAIMGGEGGDGPHGPGTGPRGGPGTARPGSRGGRGGAGGACHSSTSGSDHHATATAGEGSQQVS